MNENFSEWSKRLLSIEHLKLDINNPRFSYQSSEKMNQTQIVVFLIENYDVYELAKDIAYNGYMLGEEPVVCKEGEFYIVLEGNRRMAACKILLNPRKYLSSIKANIIEQAKFQIDKIDCHVAPNRIAANKLIYRRHNGIPVKRWSKISQDAYLNNLISIEHLNIDEINKELGVTPSEIRKALRRYNAHQKAIKLFQSFPYELNQIAQEDFPITNFERFYDSDKGAQFIGLSFTSNGKVKRHIPIKDFNERYIFIIREILNDRLNSRIFNGDKEKEDYFRYLSEKFSLIPDGFEESGFIDDENKKEENDKQQDQPQPKTKGPNQLVSNTKLFGEVDWHTDVYRIDMLFNSLQKVSHKAHLDMVAVSFRCYLDMIVYQYLKRKALIQNVCEIENHEINKENNKKYEKAKKYIITKYAITDEEIIESELRSVLNLFEKRDINYAPNLSKMLKYIATSPELLPDPKQREALNHFLTPENPLINIKSMNLLVHNEYHNITVDELKKTAIFLLPLLQHINSELKNVE